LTLNAGPGTPDLVVSQEQVWGWDYIENYLVAVFGDSFLHALFPVGTGGGVSSFWRAPAYQRGVAGIRRTERNQSGILDHGSRGGPVGLHDLPTNFKGPNLPGVTISSGPVTVYLLLSPPECCMLW